MIIEVDLPRRSLALRTPDAFDGFSVEVVGPGSPDELAAVVVRSGLGRVDPDGTHVVVDPRSVHRLAGDAATADWVAGFDGMCAYAAGKGWVEADGGIRAHVVWTEGPEGPEARTG
ncbi:MAG: hypothetical protein ACLPVF_17150 [Acidimicrobiales bacterium]